jgi:hypothetical protein
VAEATWMIAYHFGRVFIARAGEPARFSRPDVEPHARGGGERQDACTYANPIHVLDQLTAGPRDLTGKVWLLTRVFIIEPELLILRRIKMKVGIDQRWLCLSTRGDDRENRGCAKCAEPREETASRW